MRVYTAAEALENERDALKRNLAKAPIIDSRSGLTVVLPCGILSYTPNEETE